jgi:DNA repair exonuclease SbcCD ATPase subunit
MNDENQTTTPSAPRVKKERTKSRSKRWGEAASNALSAIEKLSIHVDSLESALGDLRSVQEEYEEWKDNLPENLASSALGEKLEAVTSLEIEDAAQKIRDAIDEVQCQIEEADGAELPQGFGRD